MLLVIDANELFSSVIKGSAAAKLLMSGELSLIAPELIFSEFKKHKDEILLKTHRSPADFSRFLLIIEDRIEVIPSSNFEEKLSEAVSLLPEHPKDVEYLALALRYNCNIWSDDKALKRQSSVRVFSTKELLKELRLSE